MRKEMLIPTMMILLVVLTACGRGNTEGDEDDPFTTKAHTGIHGIRMNFLNDMPPRELYYSEGGYSDQEGLIDLGIEVRNEGAYDVSDVYFYVDGYDPNMITFYDFDGWFNYNLEGKSNFNPEGGYSVKELKGYIGAEKWPEGLDFYDIRFKVTACYEYETVATPVVCIDPHPFRKMEDKPCRIGTVPTAGGQGAPVTVSSVREEATEEYIHFTIKIHNSWDGVVYDYTYADGPCFFNDVCCPDNIPYNDLNIVDYEVTLSGIEPELCRPTSLDTYNKVRMVDGEGTIYCRFNVEDITHGTVDSAFRAPLSIKLWYGYKNWIQRDVRINYVGD
ncbi:MAG: hypothetical protein KJ709_07445 [Nanoarchaeota archaeon]|nr:hypothetical protein [Nanoarchaeota archaeon]